MKVTLVHITPDAENVIVYCARVSNKKSQEAAENQKKLLQYLIQHKHWSPFEMASMCVEIKTTRAISAQILRHRSFSFQEFSTRYAEVQSMALTEGRRQDHSNRQNSIDDLSTSDKTWWNDLQTNMFNLAKTKYDKAIEKGISKEVARMILPMASETRLYMHGTIRSWVHYLDLRTGPDTQLEHRQIADEIKSIFIQQFPTIGRARYGNENGDEDDLDGCDCGFIEEDATADDELPLATGGVEA